MPGPWSTIVLFDLDGTLVDPGPGLLSSLAAGLARVGLPLPDAPERFIGPPFQESLPTLGLSAAQVETVIDGYRTHYGAGAMFDCAVYDGVPELLATLAESGHRLAVATSKPTVFAEPILDHVGLRPWFPVVSGATLDGSRRSKADIVGHALTLLAFPGDAQADSGGGGGGPDRGEGGGGHGGGGGGRAGGRRAVMVGDRSHDVVGAAAWGLAAIGAGWGYGTIGELAAAGAWRIALWPAEVGPLVAELPRSS
jgi:phosphoglycolate phosphatase